MKTELITAVQGVDDIQSQQTPEDHGLLERGISTEVYRSGKAELSLANLDQAISFIQKASVAQLSELINQAVAWRVYLLQAKKSLQLQNLAVEIKLRAERKLYEWYARQPKNKGGKPVAGAQPVTPTLKAMSIEKTWVHRLKKVSGLPEAEFGEYIAVVNNNSQELTTAGVLEHAKKVKEANERRAEYERLKDAPKFESKSCTVDFRLGDCRQVLKDIPNNSVHCIIGDPPWDEEGSRLYAPIYREAARILVPGGMCFMYSSEAHLRMSYEPAFEYLEPFEIFITMNNHGSLPIHPKKIYVRGKKIFAFSKGKPRTLTYAPNVLPSSDKEKLCRDDKFQQSLTHAMFFIGHYTRPGDTVLSPCLGSGTDGVGAKGMSRNFIGIELVKEELERADRRIAATEEESLLGVWDQMKKRSTDENC